MGQNRNLFKDRYDDTLLHWTRRAIERAKLNKDDDLVERLEDELEFDKRMIKRQNDMKRYVWTLDDLDTEGNLKVTEYSTCGYITNPIKMIELIKTGVEIQLETTGLVLLEGKYVVCLNKNRWKRRGKNKWYFHSHDVNKFVNDYIKDKTE